MRECSGHVEHCSAGGDNQALAPYRRLRLYPFFCSQTNRATDIFSLNTTTIHLTVYNSPQLWLHSRDARRTPDSKLHATPPHLPTVAPKGHPQSQKKNFCPCFFFATRPGPPIPVPFVYCNPHNSRRQCYRHRELVPPSKFLTHVSEDPTKQELCERCH
jgi:hypothetical protein